MNEGSFNPAMITANPAPLSAIIPSTDAATQKKIITLQDFNRSADQQWPKANGRFLYVRGQRFWIKGITYGTFRANEDGEPFPSKFQVRNDFAKMREAGINTVRVYTPPPDWLADAALAEGLYLMPDMCWGPRRCDFDDHWRIKQLHTWIRTHTRRLAAHPAMLLYSIGNEIPPLIVRWYGAKRIEDFLRVQNDIVKEIAPHALTTYVNHPPTEYLTL